MVLKKTFLVLSTLLCICSCKEKEGKGKVVLETKVKEDIKGKWQVLFDGTSFDNWKGYLSDEASCNWLLEEGAMVLHPPQERKPGESYNLISKKEYTDFVLSLEWKIYEGGNSGIFWGIKELPGLHEPYETGPEIQVLDNKNHPDAKVGVSHKAGALYDMIGASKDVTKPIGEWNACQITINHKTNKGIVVLNGVTIVEFPVNNPEWNDMVAKSKFANWPEFGKYTTGKIGLQDHGDKVAYRNIKIKEL